MPEAAPFGSVTLTQGDHAWLARAKALASSGWGRVHPNPMVGCVVVRDGRVVGEGWHEEFGAAHAEVNALDAAGALANGGTAYVSLEPCSHHGKTPPCTDALLKAGISTVFYAAADPGSDSRGGAEDLVEAGIRVVGPTESSAEARQANPAFFHRAEHDTPYVALKLAVSVDGFVSAGVGERTPISGPEANAWVHRLRAGFDAILVGAGTVRTDDPLLTVRGTVTPRITPVRIVVDPTASLSSTAAFFNPATAAPVLVFVTERAPAGRLEALREAGADVVTVGEGVGGCSLPEVLRVCRARGLGSILCEGGPRLAQSLVNAKFVQRLYLVTSPRTVGSQGVPMLVDPDHGWNPITEEVPLGADQLLILERGQ